jgi:outer membrane protein TolC
MNKTKWFSAVMSGTFLLIAGKPVRAQTQAQEKLTLKRAVTLALQNSRDLALARVQYTVAQKQAGVDRAEFRPNLYTGSGAAYSNGFPQTPGGAAPSVFNMSYTQAVFNPPLRGQLRAAEDRAENQRLEMERTRNGVIVRAVTEYLELAKVRHSLELLRTERESGQKILDVTRERVTAAVELPIEVTRGELSLARIEQHIVQLEGRDAILEQQFRDLTGIPADQPLEVAPEDLPATAEQPLSELVDSALSNSLDIKEAENERSAREHVLKGEKGGYWPTVNIVGLYSVLSNINNYQRFYQPGTFQRNNVTFGIDLHIPLFSAKTSANVALARSELTVAELALGNKRREIRLDAEQKIRGVRELDAAREVARLDLKLSQETLEATQAKFDQGRATLRDLEQTRLAESEKWVAFLDADFARQQAELALLQSTGQLAKVFQ